MPCEVPIPSGLFDVVDFQAEAHEHGGVDPTTIIRDDQSWALTVSWRTEGFLNGWIGGEWHLHVYAESLGPGPEVRLTDLPEDHFPALEPAEGSSSYSKHFQVDAGALQAGVDGVTLYKIVTALTYVNLAGNYAPMACHADGPIIQIYTPGGAPQAHPDPDTD